MPRFRDRHRRPGRRTPFREPKRRILVVCEGEKTEREYLIAFQNECKNPRVKVELSREHGGPHKVVREAVRLKDEAATNAQRRDDDNLRYDEVWCLFDVDQHPLISEAKLLAQANDIHLAISNPCFELWLLLHFRDHGGSRDGTYLISKLRSYVPRYDKSVQFDLYSQHYANAVKRAKKLADHAEQIEEPGRNPTTGVYRLTESIADNS